MSTPHTTAAAAQAELLPAGTPAPYNDQDTAKAEKVRAWLREHGQTRSWLARKARLSNGTVSQVLGGKYPSPPGEMLDGMLAVLQVETDRMGDGTPGYVEGQVHRLAFVVCDRTRKHGNFGVLLGNSGVGKTRTLKEYKARRPYTLMVEANPLMMPGSMMVELLEQLGVPVPAGLDAKFTALVKALLGTTYLILIDEAENFAAQSLHYLRRIRDKAEVGIVLAGTPALSTLIKPEHGQFHQIRSRVSMWPATIQRITRDDMDDMARAALHDACTALNVPCDVSDEVLDALWAYCAGSARVLTESLIPGLRDYGLGRTALSAKLVDSVATAVLFMPKRTAAQQ